MIFCSEIHSSTEPWTSFLGGLGCCIVDSQLLAQIGLHFKTDQTVRPGNSVASIAVQESYCCQLARAKGPEREREWRQGEYLPRTVNLMSRRSTCEQEKCDSDIAESFCTWYQALKSLCPRIYCLLVKKLRKRPAFFSWPCSGESYRLW